MLFQNKSCSESPVMRTQSLLYVKKQIKEPLDL